MTSLLVKQIIVQCSMMTSDLYLSISSMVMTLYICLHLNICVHVAACDVSCVYSGVEGWGTPTVLKSSVSTREPQSASQFTSRSLMLHWHCLLFAACSTLRLKPLRSLLCLIQCGQRRPPSTVPNVLLLCQCSMMLTSAAGNLFDPHKYTVRCVFG